jgi:hypothetical protein
VTPATLSGADELVTLAQTSKRVQVVESTDHILCTTIQPLKFVGIQRGGSPLRREALKASLLPFAEIAIKVGLRMGNVKGIERVAIVSSNFNHSVWLLRGNNCFIVK